MENNEGKNSATKNDQDNQESNPLPEQAEETQAVHHEGGEGEEYNEEEKQGDKNEHQEGEEHDMDSQCKEEYFDWKPYIFV